MFAEEKQKAKEIIEKFIPFASDGGNMPEQVQRSVEFENARKCALICWDEILKSKYEDGHGYMVTDKRMWHDRMRKSIETYLPETK